MVNPRDIAGERKRRRRRRSAQPMSRSIKLAMVQVPGTCKHGRCDRNWWNTLPFRFNVKVSARRTAVWMASQPASQTRLMTLIHRTLISNNKQSLIISTPEQLISESHKLTPTTEQKNPNTSIKRHSSSDSHWKPKQYHKVNPLSSWDFY